MSKQVISVDEIMKATQSGNKTLTVRLGDCIVTPGAWDLIKELDIQFADGPSSAPANTVPSIEDTTQNQPKRRYKCADSNQSSIERITDQVCSLLRDQLPPDATSNLEAIVKSVVESKISNICSVEALEEDSVLSVHGDVSLINGNKVFQEAEGPDIPGKVFISDAIRCLSDAPHTTTFMEWKNASFARTLEVPEMNLIVEGELEITVEGKTLSARAGDIFFMNKGADVVYSTPSSVKLACVNV